MNANRDVEILKKEQERFLDIDYQALKNHDFITNSFFRDPDTFNFMIYTAAHAFPTPYYHPQFPLAHQNETIRNFLGRIASARLRHHIPSVGEILPSLQNAKSDAEFVQHQVDGDVIYGFLCFTLNFNNLLVYPQKIGSESVFMIKHLFREPSPPPAEDDSETLTVFHGTNRDRLYSILRNGAKTLTVASHGRAYGDGFYTSSCPQIAMSYSDQFVLVFRLENASRFRRTKNVYVVNDEGCLELQFIIPKHLDALTLSHLLHPGKSNNLANTATSGIHSKRLLADIKKSLAYFQHHFENGVSIDIDENMYHVWTVHVKRFPTDVPLFTDMKVMGIPHITLRFEFPQDYPFSPPFVRIINPRFERWTGHVTYGGSLCAEFLTLSDTPYSWKPVLSMPTVILMIKDLLSIDGRIDKSYRPGQTYHEREAREAFHVALKKHGWK